MATRPMFYLLDGHALAYRHHFAHISRPLNTSQGEPTSAVFGFAKTVMDILEKDKPMYIAVAFDDGLSGRELLYSEYKGTRDKMPDDLERQMSRIQQIVQAFNIPVLMLSGYEADDLIGTASLQAEGQEVAPRLITGDRDMFQLITEHTTVRYAVPKPGAPDEIYDLARFRERYGLEPHQLIDLKALQGDSSDNIPGVAGIGEKTATDLLKRYGTLDEIYAHLAELKPGTAKKLEVGRVSAYLSQKLATIKRDVPLIIELPLCVAHDFDRAEVEKLYRELEFGSLFNQLTRIDSRGYFAAPAPASSGRGKNQQMSLFEVAETLEEAPETPIDPIVPTTIVQTEAALRDLVAALESAQAIAFDTETTSTDPLIGDLVGISLSTDGESAYYIPVGHAKGEQLPLEQVLDAIRPAMTDQRIPKYAHNADYDLLMLQRYGVDVQPITFDTMIAEWLRDPLNGNLGLKRLTFARLGAQMTQISDLIGTGKNQITMDRIAIERAAPYAGDDAACTFQLVDKLRADLQSRPDDPPVDRLWNVPLVAPIRVFEEIEMPLVPVIASLEQAGVLLDTAYLADLSVRLGERLAALESEIFDLSGGYGRFNINSPKQLNDVLFGKLGLSAEGLRKTTHGFSTAADVLENMRGDHPIIEKILQFRELSKLKGTYVDALPALINPRTGRVHTSYHQTGASTGRMSSSNPNLQNIPIRTEIGREVRRAFIAPPGMALLAVDYSQVELRIMAHVSKEATLLQAFEQGQDIHAATAAMIHGIPLDKVTKEQRIFAKRVNFGILYGMGAFRLARDSDLTLGQAQAFINTYFRQLPNVKAYIDGTIKLAREQGFLTTLFGRRRTFPGLHHGNRNLQQQSEREAINMPIQGTAADIIKLAMTRLYNELRERKSGGRMILQVHDELVLEVPEDELAATADLVVRTMESAADLDAPLRANAQAGSNWRDVKEIK